MATPAPMAGEFPRSLNALGPGGPFPFSAGGKNNGLDVSVFTAFDGAGMP